MLTYTGCGWEPSLGCGGGDLQENRRRSGFLRFREKGGKQREIPVRHDLDEWTSAYLEAAHIDLSLKAAPLFLRRTGGDWGSSTEP